MRSKFKSKCAVCGNTIKIGDEILRNNNIGKWVCIHCVDKKEIGDKSEIVIEKKKIKKIVPSKYQEKIFDFVKNGKGNAVVEAAAGSGKTQTILNSLDMTTGNVLFLAFNKHISDEFKNYDLPSNVKINTVHSLGFECLRKEYGKIFTSNKKIDKILDTYKEFNVEYNVEIENKIFEKRYLIKQLISLTKATLTDYKNENEIYEMINRYGLNLDEFEDEILKIYPEICKTSKSNPKYIDFDDMIWFPVIFDIECEKYDFVFVDEAQDLNKSQMKFILKCVNKNGRIIAVGDKNQSLYGFRGADTEAIPNIIKETKAITLPLSISYRCPKKHVEYAQTLVKEIESKKDAEEGNIIDIEERELITYAKDNDIVICRTNAPLVKHALRLFKQGKKVTIKGGEIVKIIYFFIKKFESEDAKSLRKEIMFFQSEELERLKSKKASESRIEYFNDRCEIIYSLLEFVKNKNELLDKAEELFNDDKKDCVIFSSVHRAKGLEAESVFILRPDLLPMMRKNQQPWEEQQEKNCFYVALTRSKKNLYFIR